MSIERQPIGEQLIVDSGTPLGPHPVHGGYVETFWLPVLGPGSICVARRLARILQLNDYRPAALDVRQLGLEIGLPGGRNGGKPERVARCLHRLVSFDLAVHDVAQRITEQRGGARVARYWLSTSWPSIPTHLLHKLPEALRSHARPPERTSASVTRSPLAS